jgi:hypothetical protein
MVLTMGSTLMGDRAKGLEYGHLPIDQQLNLGLRALEIDVVNGPKGTL